MIKYVDNEKHLAYCGSKTKRCLLCGHNVCMKDEDMHNSGGECEAFRDDDKRKKQLESKKADEAKRYLEE